MRLILTALIVLLLAPAAHAQDPYPGERDAGPRIAAMSDFAIDFLRDRQIDASVICPGGLAVHVADALLEDDGAALGRSTPCRAVILAGISRSRYALRITCKIVTHEIGHALGLARDQLISSNGAAWDSYTQRWNRMPAYTADGQWAIARQIDGHPATGFMSQGAGGIPYGCRALADRLATRAGSAASRRPTRR